MGVLKLLLENGANVNTIFEDNKNALFQIYDKWADKTTLEELYRMLLSNGIDVNHRHTSGETILAKKMQLREESEEKGELEMVDKLTHIITILREYGAEE